jgi:thiamine-phosphate pyrophosphorylase
MQSNLLRSDHDLGPIYGITDPFLLPGEQLFKAVEQALSAGIKTIQLRDKTADSQTLLESARELVMLCNAYDARCIINDRWDIALESGAHGVHLGQADGSVIEARARLGAEAIIGVTCHSSLELARLAQAEGASYVAFGRFFSSNTKPLAGAADIEVLRQAVAEIELPIIAIGGIRQDNMAPLVQAGATTLAVCHSLFGAPDVRAAAEQLLNTFRQSAFNSSNDTQ